MHWAHFVRGVISPVTNIPIGFHLGLLVVVIGLGLLVALACGLGFLLVVVLSGCTWLRRWPICLLVVAGLSSL